jgi:hypothetical protein
MIPSEGRRRRRRKIKGKRKRRKIIIPSMYFRASCII